MLTSKNLQNPGQRTLTLGVFRLLAMLAILVVATRSISAAPAAEPPGDALPVTGQEVAATPIAEEPVPTETAYEPAAEATISLSLSLPREHPVTTDSVSAIARFTESPGAGQVNGTIQFAVCGPGSASPCTVENAVPLGGPRTFSVPFVQSQPFTPASVDATGTYCFLVEYQPSPGSAYQPATFTDSNGCVTFTQPSLTIILAGKDDSGDGGHLVDFGVVSSTGTAPTVDGVSVSHHASGATYRADNALRVTVLSDGPGWTGTCYVSDAGVTNLDLAWNLDGGAGVPFASDAGGGQGCIPSAPAGTSEGLYIYDLLLTVRWDDSPGTTTATVIFGVTAP